MAGGHVVHRLSSFKGGNLDQFPTELAARAAIARLPTCPAPGVALRWSEPKARPIARARPDRGEAEGRTACTLPGVEVRMSPVEDTMDGIIGRWPKKPS